MMTKDQEALYRLRYGIEIPSILDRMRRNLMNIGFKVSPATAKQLRKAFVASRPLIVRHKDAKPGELWIDGCQIIETNEPLEDEFVPVIR